MQQRDSLIGILQDMRRVAVALSGGVDSSVVAQAAFLALKHNAVAVTADSPSVARADLDDAKRIAAAIGIRHVIVNTGEFDDPNYQKNDGTRCYFCKSELYRTIHLRMAELNVDVICSGANLDDLGDYRPGLLAAAENSVRHPLQEAGFTKAAVRDLAKEWNLAVWDKPASPCLSSRIAPGLAVTVERTARVERAERYLKNLGLSDCRVRYHEGDLARIEVPLAEMAKILSDEPRSTLEAALRSYGFRYVTIDLAGLRSGSLNDLIPLEVKRNLQRRLVMP